MFKKIVIILCLFQLSIINCQLSIALAQQDSIRVTLLTCSPGPEIYELYGHTAIRCQTPKPPLGEERTDIVFNYGVFDMSKPYFAWHFVLGQTDYMVQPVPWEFFVREYDERGSSITEQELNLTPSEARRLLSRLLENCLPENCQYRYNFLYKNCTTMVRDMVEGVIDGSIQYPDTLPHQTYREVLHHYTPEHPWAQEGNDLLLGAEVDTILSEHAAMFVPENLMRAYDGAFIITTRGDMRPLVKSKELRIIATNLRTIVPLIFHSSYNIFHHSLLSSRSEASASLLCCLRSGQSAFSGCGMCCSCLRKVRQVCCLLSCSSFRTIQLLTPTGRFGC